MAQSGVAFLGGETTFNDGTDFISISPFFGAAMYAEISTQVTAGVNIGGNGRISFPAHGLTFALPPIFDFAAFGADEFKTKASIFAFAAAVRKESLGSIHWAARGAG